MCGFTGYVDLNGERPVDRALLERMTEKLQHRGPDSCGYWVSEGVGFGFRRLSIVDLETGDQPLFSEDRRLVLFCNGEVFNHQELRRKLISRGHTFRTKSDVEVIIHLYEDYGRDLVHHLNGQFAFVLYDRESRDLLLARDHFGIVPLFYAVVDGFFVFGSEIKALLEHPAVPRKVDLTGFDQVLSFPGLLSPRTLFQGIHSLPRGHLISIKDGQLETAEYWDLDYPRDQELDASKPEEYYRDRLQELLFQSVDLRLQADVPVGLYLSGGLDSSLIAAIATELGASKRHSFSIAFTEKAICESSYQRMMAERLNTQHHEITFDWSQIAERLREMVYHCECPVKESYNTCSLALSELARSHGVKVVLTGEGSDELFAGYPGYRFDQLGLRGAAAPDDFEALLEDELRESLWGDSSIFYEKEQYAFREIRQSLYSSEVNKIFSKFDCTGFPVVNKERLRGRHAIHQRSYLDFTLRLSDHLLADHGDRMALANSVEVRYPFLDIKLVEFARCIPPGLKLKDFTEKYIVQRVARDLLPPEIVGRQKFGFRAPGTPFLLQQETEWIHDILSYDRVKRRGYFSPETVEHLKKTYSQAGFSLDPLVDTDFLMVVITFDILCDLFDLPDF